MGGKVTWSSQKCSMYLKLAINRLRIQKAKSIEAGKARQKAVSELLAEGKVKMARVKTITLVHEDLMLEVYNILELYCQTINARLELINLSKLCPEDMRTAVCSVVFAAPQMQVEELMHIRRLFMARYGPKFPCRCLDLHCVNPKVVERLKRAKPSDRLMDHYLCDIARKFDVPFDHPVYAPEPEAECCDEPVYAPPAVVVVPQGNLLPPGVLSGPAVSSAPPPVYSHYPIQPQPPQSQQAALFPSPSQPPVSLEAAWASTENLTSSLGQRAGSSMGQQPSMGHMSASWTPQPPGSSQAVAFGGQGSAYGVEGGQMGQQQGHLVQGPGLGSLTASEKIDVQQRAEVDARRTVVLAMGSGSVVAGMYGSDRPQVSIPCVIGYTKGVEAIDGQGEEGGEEAFWVGEEAERYRGILRLSHPIEQGVAKDWDSLRKILVFVFRQLGVAGASVLCLSPPLASAIQQSMLATILFSSCSVAQVRYEEEAACVLRASGRSTGLVVDCGAGLLRAVPVVDGSVVTSGVAFVPFGGYHLDLLLVRLLRERGANLTTTAEMEIARDMREKLCFVSGSYEEDLRRPQAVYQEYLMPDGRAVGVDTERFRATEAIFLPSLLGVDAKGLHHQVLAAVMACPAARRREILCNLVLAGGVAQTRGLEARLGRELAALTPPGTEIQLCGVPDIGIATFRAAAHVDLSQGTWKKSG